MAHGAIRAAGGYEIAYLPSEMGVYTMMPLWRPGTPQGGELTGHDEYAMWDAAYVLGSLTSAERREFEAHMTSCPLCRSAVGEFTGLPALLSQLDRDDMAAIDRSGVERLLPDRVAAVAAGKGELAAAPVPIVTWTSGAAAAAVLAIGLLVGVSDFADNRARAAAGERVGSADGAGRHESAGLDGVAQQPALGNVHRDELRLPGPAECASRHTGDGRGRS